MPAATGTVIISLDNKVTDCELLPGRDETVFSINIPGRGRIDEVKEQTAVLPGCVDSPLLSLSASVYFLFTM